MAARASVIWLDYNGVTRQTIITGADLLGLGTIWVKAQACSRAQVETTWAQDLGAAVGAATTGNYQSNKMAARLLFETASGSILSLTIPAPDIAIFKADGVTIDPTNADIVALIAACIGELSDTSGAVATSFLGGALAPGRNDLPPIA